MIVDGLVIAVLLVSAIISFLRGFIRECLTILGVAGGAAAAYYGGPMALPIFNHWLGVKEGEPPHKLFDVIPDPIVAQALSYGVIFIVVVIALSIISHLLAESARKVGLGPLDRTLGVVFGLARGVLLVGILYLPVYIGVDKQTKEEWFKDSKTDVYLEAVADKISSLIPQSALKDIKDTTKDAQKDATAAGGGLKDQLQKIDLLKGAGQGSGTEPAQMGGAPGGDNNSGEAGSGYSDAFRAKMKELFEQGGGQGSGQQTVPVAPISPPAPQQPAPPAGGSQ